MTERERTEEPDWDPNRYIIWEGPNAESMQFWEDEFHDHHDRMSVTHTACPDCGHDIRHGTDWAHPIRRSTT